MKGKLIWVLKKLHWLYGSDAAVSPVCHLGFQLIFYCSKLREKWLESSWQIVQHRQKHAKNMFWTKLTEEIRGKNWMAREGRGCKKNRDDFRRSLHESNLCTSPKKQCAASMWNVNKLDAVAGIDGAINITQKVITKCESADTLLSICQNHNANNDESFPTLGKQSRVLSACLPPSNERIVLQFEFAELQSLLILCTV